MGQANLNMHFIIKTWGSVFMLFIGERLNGMFKSVRVAIENRDKKAIQHLAETQISMGADYLDLNVGAAENPVDAMKWLVECVQELGNVKLSIDSSKIEVLEAGLSLAKNEPILNSISADTEKMSELFPMARKFGASVIALTMDEKGIPSTVDARIELAALILATSVDYNFPSDKIFLDPLILPVNVAQNSPNDVLKTISAIKDLDVPAPKTVLGLSNVSQNCSNRGLINRTFLAMAMSHGLDAAILDVSDRELINTAITANIILNKDIYCDSFLKCLKTSVIQS